MAGTPLTLPFAKGKDDIAILPRMANRHGLIAGATGTGMAIMSGLWIGSRLTKN